ncbi:major facilitator superfamily domain-containing protein [Phycomyces blakesleeanus]|uniref:Major facilitator superfamily domain-containing protein n=1 Tax=Phycomyces blakesleeanus TaxID=4837 RepID=A0ABR3AYL6_PHYBL
MNSLSWIHSLWLALANIVGPFFCFFAYRIGYKWMLVVAIFLCSGSMMLASLATQVNKLSIFLTQGVLAGIGASLVWFPCVSAAQQWFSRKRGLSVGLAISGSGFGGLVLSNVIQAAIDNLGYRWSLRILGFITFALLCICAAFVRPLNRPSHVSGSRIIDLSPLLFIFVCRFLLVFFQVRSQALSAISAGVMIVGKISGGLLGDYCVGRSTAAFLCTILTGVMCLGLWLNANSAATVWAFAAMFGLFGGGYLTTVPAVLAQVVGMEDIEAANGLLFFGWFFGGLFGTPISSALINNVADEPTYNYAIIFSGVILVAAGILLWVIRVQRGGWYPFKMV